MTYRFIEEDTTDLTALDADQLTDDELEISGIFIGETEELAFIIGNTGSDYAHFHISTSGLNTTINDDVEYSVDSGVTWETSANVSGVEPNGLSQRIRLRYTPADEELLGVGSFLIRVDEE